MRRTLVAAAALVFALASVQVAFADSARGPATIRNDGASVGVPAIDIRVKHPLVVATPGNGIVEIDLVDPTATATPTPTATQTSGPTATVTATATFSPAPTPTPDAADQVARSTAAGVIGYTALADCGDAGEKCTYDTDTGLWTTGIDDDVPEVGDFGALDPTACPGGQYMTDITSGAAVCAQVAFSQLSGTATDAQVPDSITVDLATAASALAANGSNCTGTYEAAKGVSAAGVAEGCWAVPTPGPAPTTTPHPTVLPTAACSAATVGQTMGDADALDGQQAHTCHDLLVFTCIGGTNDGGVCGNSSSGNISACPSGTYCARYAWRRPATRFAIGAVTPGTRCETVQFSSNFAQLSGVNGTCTVSPAAELLLDTEALPSGAIPDNIQALNATAHPVTSDTNCKYLGASNQVAFCYSTQKYCWGGTNANATCSNDTACPGGVCQDFEVHDGKPARFDDGAALGVPLKTADINADARAGTASWCVNGGTTDIPNLTMDTAIFNGAQHRTIEKICWRTNVTGGGFLIRRDGPTSSTVSGYPTPVPTILLPTPTAAATPGHIQADAGCLTGLSIEWPKDANLAIQWTTGTGVTRACVRVTYSLKP